MVNHRQYPWGWISESESPRPWPFNLLPISRRFNVIVELKPNFWFERMSAEAVEVRINRLFGKNSVIELVGSQAPGKEAVITAFVIDVSERHYSYYKLGLLFQEECHRSIPTPSGSI